MGTNQNAILLKSNPLVDSLAPNNGHKKDGMMGKEEEFIGVLEVFIHQARNIHNVCIYHKQDVYAKIFLTSDPKSTESTRTINGAGQNPVFDESLRINVRNGDCLLRCEVWMLSRIKNYLQDQLLGFALVPLSEILVENGTLEKEYELLTSEVVHSSCGFVKLSIIYTGSQPEVLEIINPTSCLCDQDSCENERISSELEKIEFPDPKIMNENEIMVSDYYSKCEEIESQSVVICQSQSQITESDDSLGSGSNDTSISRVPEENIEITSVTNVEIATNLEPLEKKEDYTSGIVDSIVQTDNSIKKDFEQEVVQKDIEDIYLKSMQQFTEALAKMNLPVDKGSQSCDLDGNDSIQSNGRESKGEGTGPKVFYGSRAFF